MAEQIPRLLDFYQNECVPQLMEQFNYDNINRVPKIVKTVLNMGGGRGHPEHQGPGQRG